MLITAGPTHEAIDAVRYLANRSSGRMGIALAEAARDAGWDVTLALGPVAAEPPNGIEVVRFVSSAELESLLAARFPRCDVLVMAAAVADFRPRKLTKGKLSRGDSGMSIELEATPDLVAACAARKRPGQRIIGFALEEDDRLEDRATEKLRAKKLDAVVANPLSTMGASDVRASVYLPDGRCVSPPMSGHHSTKLDKSAFARWFIGWVAEEW